MVDKQPEMLVSEIISAEDQDVLGEICNISMGTAAETLSLILQHTVHIDTPNVTVFTWNGLRDIYGSTAVGVRVGYEVGLSGSNILLLKDRDVKIITDIMMGGAGNVEEPIELNEMDMSAISEAMNQMVGSTATSLSSMLKKKVDISPPQAFNIDFSTEENQYLVGVVSSQPIAMVDFNMKIGNLISSEVVQIFNMDAALELVNTLKQSMFG